MREGKATEAKGWRTAFRALRKDARAWWYHRQLRERGNAAEARKREHRSVREHINYLKEALANGGFLKIGRGGSTLHMADGHRLEGYDRLDRGIGAAALAVGIPVIDSTTAPDDRIIKAINFPMIGIKRVDPRPWRALSFAPLAHVAGLYKGIGATLYNFDKDALKGA